MDNRRAEPMTDHQAACAALREARIAIEAGNIALAELAVRDAERAMEWREGPAMVFQVVLDKSRPQTDLTCLMYREG